MSKKFRLTRTLRGRIAATLPAGFNRQPGHTHNPSTLASATPTNRAARRAAARQNRIAA